MLVTLSKHVRTAKVGREDFLGRETPAGVSQLVASPVIVCNYLHHRQHCSTIRSNIFVKIFDLGNEFEKDNAAQPFRFAIASIQHLIENNTLIPSLSLHRNTNGQFHINPEGHQRPASESFIKL